MFFLHPAMLALSAAAAAPWVVHLLNRGRTRSVPWGAMMFLGGNSSTGDYRSRLRSWGLMFLRSLMIAAAAVALARPVVKPGGLSWPTAGLRVGGPATVMIVLDTSPAMTYTANNRSRFDQARAVSLELLSDLDPGTHVGLLASTGSVDPIPPSSDIPALSGKLLELQPTAGDDDLAASLDRAAKLIESAGQSDDRRIYVVCDRHAAAWKNANDAFCARWADRHHPAVMLVPVGGEESDNIAVDSVRIVDPPVLRDVPATVEVMVRNLGPTARSGVPLSVYTPGDNLASTAVQIPAKSQKAVRLPVRFKAAGSHVLSAVIESTGLTVDDRADAAVDVVEAIHVTHVTAPGGTGGAVSLALAPYAAVGRRMPGDAVVSDAADDKWAAGALAGADVVVVDGGVKLSPQHAAEIEQFVLDGGGLLLLPGAGPAPIDPQLWRLVSSTTLGALVPAPGRIASIDRNDRIWRFLGDRPLPEMSFPDRLALTGLTPDGKVTAKFDGDAPAMVRFSPARGRVLAVAGSVGEFVRSPIFLPWIQSAVHSLAAGKVVDRNLPPWRSIEERTTAQAEAATVLLPSGKRDPAAVTRFEDGSDIRYTRTAVPGTYRLHYRAAGKDVMENFVVSQPGTAVDLTPVTEASWKSLVNRSGFEKIDSASSAVAAAAGRSGASREVWIDLVGLVVLLAVLESLWSWVFSGTRS